MDAASRSPNRFFLPALVAVATAVVFLPSLRGEFLLWDDDTNFTFNPYFRGFTRENLQWMFTNAFGHYMPLTWLTLALDYTFWGMNPLGYHITNIALHSLNAVLCYFVLLRLVRRASPDLDPSTAAGASAAGALLFSIHPLRVESVAWITERRDVLSGAFFLLTVLAYLRMTGTPERSPARLKALALTAVVFAAMLLSKTMGLTLPLALLVLDVYPLRRFSRDSWPGLLKEKIPLFALMFGALAMLLNSAGTAGGMSDRQNYPLIQSVARPGSAVMFYVAKTLLPVGLSPLYWYRPELGLPQVIGWGMLLALTAILVIRRDRCPGVLAAWLSYGLLIAPASGVVSLGSFFAADHYSYVACLPFAAAGAALVVLLSRRWPAPALAAVFAAVLIGYAVHSWRYCAVWKDSVSLWTRAVELEPDVYFSRANLARSLAARGEWDRAIEEYTRSIEMQPGWHETFSQRGRARLVRGDLPGAIDDATRAIQLDPRQGEAYNTRGMALSRLGKPREAIADLTRALELRPRFVEARVNRAFERAKVGDPAGSLADLDAAIELDPQPHLFVRRGVTRAATRDFRGAVADFEQALQRAPADWPQRAQVEKYLLQARSELPR